MVNVGNAFSVGRMAANNATMHEELTLAKYDGNICRGESNGKIHLEKFTHCKKRVFGSD